MTVNKIINNNIWEFFTKKKFMLKHELSGQFDEDSKYTKNKHRVYRDITTDTFVEIFLSDTIHRYNFIDYTFHKLNNDIQININDYLIKENNLPLNGTEKIVLIFKGGNIMNELGMNKLNDFDLFNETNVDKIREKYNYVLKGGYNKFEEMNKKMRSYLKISDVDYTIYIITKTYARFNLIYEKVLHILSKSLYEITSFFDNIFNRVVNQDTNKYAIENKKNIIYNQKFNPKITSEITHFNNLLKLKIYNEEFGYNNELNKIHYFVSLFNNNSINDIMTLSYLYQIIELYEHIIKNVSEFIHVKRNIKKRMNDMIKNMENKITNSNFYTRNKINKFKNDLVKNINSKKLNDIEYYEVVGNGFKQETKTYELIKELDHNDIEIKKRSDFVVMSNNDSSKLYEKYSFPNDERYHYITFNNVIKDNLQKGTNMLDFDLIRSKFNVVIDNCIKVDDNVRAVNIPSEFIDISIPKFGTPLLYNSNLEHHYIYQTLEYVNNNVKKIINVNTLTIEEIYRDLIVVLFEQNYFCPWIDNKYEKRISRTVYFLYLYCENNNNDMKIFEDLISLAKDALEFLNSKPDIKNNRSLEQLKEINNKFLVCDNSIAIYIYNIYNSDKNANYPFYINFVKPEYELVQFIITNILFFCNLSLDNYLFIDVINKIRKYYNFVPIDKNNKDFYDNNYESLKKMLITISDFGYYLLYIYDNKNFMFGGSYYTNINRDNNEIIERNKNKISKKRFTNENKKNNSVLKKFLNQLTKQDIDHFDTKQNIGHFDTKQNIDHFDNYNIDYLDNHNIYDESINQFPETDVFINQFSEIDVFEHGNTNDIETVIYNTNSGFTLKQTKINIKNDIQLKRKNIIPFSYDYKDLDVN